MRRSRSICLLVLASFLCVPACTFGQVLVRQIGGVAIDANGVLASLSTSERNRQAQLLREQLLMAPAELSELSHLRMVSLAGLQAEIKKSLAAGQLDTSQLPEEIRFLAGLQRVEYIFVLPERNDIVIAGPGEGWQVGPSGQIVGVSTGLPVLLLDDLLVALRTVKDAYRVGISCSIDPTAEGRQALENFLRRQTRFTPAVINGVKQSLGDQQISITGVPTESHFAGVLAASDYRMKRLAMNLEPAPIAGMPGFIDLIKKQRGGLDNMMPRWWMACNYDAVARSDDGLAWQIRGQGVKVLTEDDFIEANGAVRGTGKVNPRASSGPIP